MARAFVFPGQGSQAVGMGRALAEAYPAARAVFDEVDAALGERLSATIWDGPEDALALTANAQPALMAMSMAVVRALQAEGVDVAAEAAFVAGHSLGEYSALCAAGALSVADAARLLRLRGQAMQTATPVGVGAMAALLGVDLPAAAEIAAEAAEGQVCAAANDNAPGQVVVSGDRAAVERAVALAAARGAKKAVMLSVSAPFHCALMAPAAEAMRAALAEVEIRRPNPALVANVVAEAVDDPERIRALLVAQVTGAVRWRESVAWMATQGVTELVELGAGKVLSGLAKRIDKGLTARAVGAPEDVAAFARAIGEAA
ncbi:MAG: ACP S-malonyltransferase [Rubrimonas sp.]